MMLKTSAPSSSSDLASDLPVISSAVSVPTLSAPKVPLKDPSTRRAGRKSASSPIPLSRSALPDAPSPRSDTGSPEKLPNGISAIAQVAGRLLSVLTPAEVQQACVHQVVSSFEHLGVLACQFLQPEGDSTYRLLASATSPKAVTECALNQPVRQLLPLAPALQSLLTGWKSGQCHPEVIWLPYEACVLPQASLLMTSGMNSGMPSAHDEAMTLVLPVWKMPATPSDVSQRPDTSGNVHEAIAGVMLVVCAAPLSDALTQALQEISGLLTLAIARVQTLETAWRLATHDELTGLLNRRAFYEGFELELERARRTHKPISVVMLDVDYFKQVNDTHGHLAGDAVLMQLAKALKDNLRKNDIVCRFGGEEFVLVLPNTSLKLATDLVDRIRQRVAAMTFATPAGVLSVSFSAGLAKAVIPRHRDETFSLKTVMSEALSEADGWLYEAKLTGRNRVLSSLTSGQESS